MDQVLNRTRCMTTEAMRPTELPTLAILALLWGALSTLRMRLLIERRTGSAGLDNKAET
jgi:hypothetical protein